MELKNLYIFFIIIFPIMSVAQINDAGAWLSLNAEKKITPDFSITLSEEARLNENFSEPGSFFTDAGVSYRINKLVKLSANYRFIQKRKLNDSYNLRHRFYFDISLRHKIKPLVFMFRTRLQQQQNEIYEADDDLCFYYYSRNKFTLKADLDKNYVPYFYIESYTPLNSPIQVFLDKVRYCAGFEYKLNRRHSFDLFYLIQKEYNEVNPVTDFIMGVGYNLVF